MGIHIDSLKPSYKEASVLYFPESGLVEGVHFKLTSRSILHITAISDATHIFYFCHNNVEVSERSSTFCFFKQEHRLYKAIGCLCPCSDLPMLTPASLWAPPACLEKCKSIEMCLISSDLLPVLKKCDVSKSFIINSKEIK
jgi:hypothetical protein